MSHFSVTVPVLPDRLLSSNGGKRSRRNPWAIAEARGRLKNEVMEALKDKQPLPTFDRCTADVTLYCTSKRPRVEQCPRCLLAALDDRSVDSCRCYRPRDVGNIGGDVLKPVLDALVWMEMLPDDDRTHLTAITLRIEAVTELENERIEVTVMGGRRGGSCMTTQTKPGQELVGHSGNDEIGTPQWLFDNLHRRFMFDLDAAASHENAKCDYYCTKDGLYRVEYDHLPGIDKCVLRNVGNRIAGSDGIETPWRNRRVFVNPPYSRPLMGQFIEKAIEERNDAEIVVMLVKYDASTENGRLLREHFHLEYLNRVKYDGMEQGATFPSVVAIVRPDPPRKPR